MFTMRRMLRFGGLAAALVAGVLLAFAVSGIEPSSDVALAKDSAACVRAKARESATKKRWQALVRRGAPAARVRAARTRYRNARKTRLRVCRKRPVKTTPTTTTTTTTTTPTMTTPTMTTPTTTAPATTLVCEGSLADLDTEWGQYIRPNEPIDHVRITSLAGGTVTHFSAPSGWTATTTGSSIIFRRPAGSPSAEAVEFFVTWDPKPTKDQVTTYCSNNGGQTEVPTTPLP